MVRDFADDAKKENPTDRVPQTTGHETCRERDDLRRTIIPAAAALVFEDGIGGTTSDGVNNARMIRSKNHGASRQQMQDSLGRRRQRELVYKT